MTSLVWALPPDAFTSTAQRFVMLAVADCHNEERDQCNPSIQHLADKTGISYRQVKRHLVDLAEAGWIEKHHRGRRGDGSLHVWFYTLNVESRSGSSTSPRSGSPTSPRAPTEGSPTSPRSGSPTSPRSGSPTSPRSGSPTSPRELELELEGELEVELETREPETTSTSFDDFWDHYPRKVAKPKTRESFDRAIRIRHNDPATVMAGLARWQAYWTAANEPEFIPHPTTWLNQDRFNDTPPPLKRKRKSNSDNLADVLALYAENGMTPGDSQIAVQ